RVSAVLIFASGIKHARHIQATLQEKHGQECGFVSGETPSGEREELLARFLSVCRSEGVTMISEWQTLDDWAAKGGRQK
ncbi:MAG: hypothetical protein HGA94_05515, partial [Candidatus Aminicenantes bacterium]|nr:hypothetical protein [Candidatus Aminicenantes bacterium]